MLYPVDSLFNIVMKFLVKNIFQVESFVGFPSLVGEEVFKRFVNEFDVTKDILLHGILKKFVDAYEYMVLERLNLSKQLLILNEYFESIATLSRFITELCVCDCFLGANHEIYLYILRCERLKTLCLRNNSMDDSAVRVLTLQTRMYGVGGKSVENLDLSGNNLSDKMIPWMSAFPKLSFLNLSGSNITEKGVNTLAKQYNLRQIFDREQHKEVTTTGWAAALLDKWIEKMTLSKKKRKILKPMK